MNTSQSPSLEDLQKTGSFAEIENDQAFHKLFYEIKTIRKKMSVLPTVRESEALPELNALRSLTRFLNEKSLPVLEAQLEASPRLKKLFYEEYLEGVVADVIRARVYSNKEIVRVADEIFANLVAYCSRRMQLEDPALFGILNTITDRNSDYYRTNGKESNVMEWAFGEPIKANEDTQRWLQSLRKGELVDCLKPHAFKKCWSRAYFEGSESGLTKVRFLTEVNISFISSPEFEIAKLGSKSTDFEWRESLAVDSLVDHFHYKSEWILYRVVSVQMGDNMYGDNVKTVVIRREVDGAAEGGKGEEGTERNGARACSLTYSDEISSYAQPGNQTFPVKVHSPLLAPPGLYSRKKETVISDSDDAILLAQTDTKKYAILRPGTNNGSNSIYFIKYANVFGQNGGFDFMMAVASGQRLVKQETTVNLVQLVQNFSECLVEPFVKEHGKVLLDWLTRYLQVNIEKNIRLFTQIHLANFIEAVSLFTRRVYAETEGARIAHEWIVRIGIVCLRSEILEKQFFGAKKIIEVEERVKSDDPHQLRAKLAEQLLEENIYEKIIKGHPTLIEKGFGALKVLFTENRITNEQLAQLWEQVRKVDSESKSALLFMLKAISWDMTKEQIQFLMKRMVEQPVDTTSEILEVMSTLRQVASNKHRDAELVSVFNEVIWQMFQNDKGGKPELEKELVLLLVKNAKLDSLVSYVSKAVQNLLSGRNKERNLKLLVKFLKEPGCFDYSIIRLLEEKQVIAFCVEEIRRAVDWKRQLDIYSEAVDKTKVVAAGNPNEEKTGEETTPISAIESKQAPIVFQELIPLNRVFKFLTAATKYAQQNCELKVFTFADFAVVFQVIFTARVGQKTILEWLFAFLGDQKNELELPAYKQFFEENFPAMARDNTEEFFKFFLLTFLNINKLEGSVQSKQLKLENCHNACKTSLRKVFIAQKPFEEMYGAELLWKVLLQSADKRVFIQIANFISNFNLGVEFAEDCNPELYARQKKTFLARSYELFMSGDAGQAQKAGIFLTRIIKAEEMNRSCGLVSFAQLKEAERIPVFAEKGQQYLKEKVKVWVSENQTVFQLKEQVASEYKIPFELVGLTREDGTEVGSADNTLTIESAGIQPGESLVMKERETPQAEFDFFTADKADLSEHAKKVVAEVFNEFAVDKKMTQEQFLRMYDKMGQTPTAEFKEEKANAVFRSYDTEGRGYIRCEHLVDYFRKTALDAHDRTMVMLKQGFHALGYGRNLRLVKFPVETDAEFARKSTRFLLSNDILFYRLLLDYIKPWFGKDNPANLTTKEAGEHVDATEVSEYFLKLIQILPPLFADVELTLKDPVAFIANEQNAFVIFYKTTILNGLIFRRDFVKTLEWVCPEKVVGTYDAFLKKVISPEWGEGLLRITRKSAESTDYATWPAKILSPLRLLERILKVNVAFKDPLFVQSLKNVVSYFIKRKIKAQDASNAEDSSKRRALADSKAANDLQREDRDSEDEQLLAFKKRIAGLGQLDSFESSLDYMELNTIALFLLNALLADKAEMDRSQRNLLKNLVVVFAASVKLNENELRSLIQQENFQRTMIRGLTSEKNLVRIYFKNLYSILASETEDVQMKTKLLKVLLSSLGSNEREELHGLVELACAILGEIGELKARNPATADFLHSELNFLELFVNFKQLLFKHESLEKQFDEGDDNLLIGYLAFLEKILKTDELVLASLKREDKQELTGFIFKECLFGMSADGISLPEAKCKSKKSRALAYDLLKQLLKEDAKLNVYFLATCLGPLSRQIPDFQAQNQLTAESERKSRDGFVGIRNLGCVCYMIATLQQFYCTPAFRYGILMAEDQREVEPALFRNRTIDDNVFHQFQKMMVYLDQSERRDFCPQDFCFSYKDYSGEPTNVTIQQDADEFLKVILERLENSLKKSPFLGVLNSVYLGKICNVITCKACGHEKTNEENFYNISLEVKKMNNIQESFDKLVQEEIISDYMCDRCKKKSDISKRATLKKLPNVLILSLKKMCFDLELLVNVKIHSRYEFPMKMDLRRYMHVASAKSAEDGSESAPLPVEEENCEYKLVGVVVHKGNAEFGHYTSLINANRGDPSRPVISEDKWFEFDDSRVTAFDMSKFEEECFGVPEDKEFMMNNFTFETVISKSAYLLVYDKVQKDKLVFPFTEETSEQKKVILQNLIDSSDVELTESSLSTSFYNLKQFAPEPYRSEVSSDNKLFGLEQHLLSRVFTFSIAEIIQNADLSLEKVSEGEDQLEAWNSKKILSEALLNTLPLVLTKVYCVAHENFKISHIVGGVERALKYLSFVKKCKPSWEAPADQKIASFFHEHMSSKFTDIVNSVINTNDVPLKNGLTDYLVEVFTAVIDNFGITSLAVASSNCSELKDQVAAELSDALQILVDSLSRIEAWTTANKKLGSMFGVLKRLSEKNECVARFLADAGLLPFLNELYANTDVSRMIGMERILTSVIGLIRILWEFEKNNLAENEVYTFHLEEIKKYEVVIKAIHEDHKFDGFDEVKALVRAFCAHDRVTSEIIVFYCLKNFSSRTETEVIGQLEAFKALLSIKDSLAGYRMRLIFGIPQLTETWSYSADKVYQPYYGLGREAVLKSATCNYISPFALERGLLEWIWSSKESAPKSTMLMIFYLVDWMVDYDEVFQYIVQLDPPNYLSATFYDWFESYCEYHLKSTETIYSSFKSEFDVIYGGQLPGKLSSLQTKLMKYPKRPEQTPTNRKFMYAGETPYTGYLSYSLNKYAESDRIQIYAQKPNYIIGKTVKVSRAHKYVLEETQVGKFSLKFNVVNLSLLPSRPCGASNLAVPGHSVGANFAINKSKLGAQDSEFLDFLGVAKSAEFNDSSSEENAHLSHGGEQLESISRDNSEPNETKNTTGTEKNDPEKQVHCADYLLSMGYKNATEESFFLKLRTEWRSQWGAFEEQLMVPVKVQKKDTYLGSLTLPDLEADFSGVRIFACWKFTPSVLIKDYSDDGFTDWELVFTGGEDAE